MYSVSAAYLAALALPVHKYRLTGTVGTEAFSEANIVSGSLSVSNKVSEGSEIKLGSVYTGELKGKFTGMSIARGAWVGKTITLSEGLLIDADNDTYEDVPLGIFTVAEANHTAEGVEVTAYDAMTAFDKTRNDLTDTGTAYAFLTLMCQKCGVTLGSTLADIQALPNGTETFSIYAENDIETWRDLLSWIAQTLGAVATIGRDGKLYLRQYSMTAAATIDETHRFTGCSFSDFVTYYTGMSVVDIALRQTEYKSEVVDDGLTYNLGSNPLVQGHYEYVQEIIDDFSNVALTPFNAQMLGGAIYDLCDCLTFSGGIASGATCGVMGYTWKYNGAYSVKGFGANPALATAKSKTQKELEALYNTVGQEINEMSVVQNSTAVTIAENTETSILKYNFEVTQEENTTMVDVSVVMTATATEQLVGEIYTLGDIVAALTFYVDNSQVTVYDPTFIVDEGKDTMTFNFSLSGLSVGGHEFDIRLRVNGGTGSIAVHDVHEILWGYGITFEVYVKNIAVTQMPTKTVYYVGQHLNYAGLEVSKVYNNGLLEDVTEDCTLDPVEGTELTEYDLGTFPVQVAFEDFSTDFNLTVRDLAYKYLIGNTEMFHDTESSMYNNTLCRFVSNGDDLYCISRYMTSDYADFKYWIAKINPNIQNDDIEVLSVQSGTLTRSSNYNFKGGVVIGENWYVFELGGLAYPPKVHCINLRLGTVTQMTVTNTYAPDPSYTIWGGGWTASRIYSVGDKIFIGDISTVITKNGTNQQIWTVAYATINGTSMNVIITGETGDYDVGDNGKSIYCSYKNVVLSAPLKYKKLISTDDSCCYVYKIVIDENGYHKDLVGTYTGVGWNGSSFVTFPDLDILVFQNNDPNNRLCGYLDCDTGESYEATNTMYLAYVEGNPVWDSEKELFLLDAGLLGLKRSGDLDEWADIDCIESESGATRVGYRYSFNGTIWTAGYTSESSGGVTTYHFYPIAYSFEGIS